jgi:hypothetical protein
MIEFFYGIMVGYLSVALILVAKKVAENDFTMLKDLKSSDYDI